VCEEPGLVLGEVDGDLERRRYRPVLVNDMNGHLQRLRRLLRVGARHGEDTVLILVVAIGENGEIHRGTVGWFEYAEDLRRALGANRAGSSEVVEVKSLAV